MTDKSTNIPKQEVRNLMLREKTWLAARRCSQQEQISMQDWLEGAIKDRIASCTVVELKVVPKVDGN